MKVLCVCLGNICRSPLAEGVLAKAAKDRDLDIEVDSAGTANYHEGNAPDPRSIAEAARRGLDISQQRARQLNADDLSYYDHVLVMDASNYQQARAFAKTADDAAKVELIMNYATPGRNEQVPDPYYNDDGFAGVYDMLERAVEGFLNQKNQT